MATHTRYGSIKRFGARYGRRVKYKVGKVEEARRLSTLCPYCHRNAARRRAAGIWECKKCENVFTGRAYVIGRGVEAKKENPPEAVEEVEEEVEEAA